MQVQIQSHKRANRLSHKTADDVSTALDVSPFFFAEQKYRE